MPGFNGGKFDDRASASVAAKKAALEKFKSRPAPDDPAVLARQAELKAIADAREARATERRLAKEAEARRLAEEEAARIAAEKARIAADAAEKARLAAEQKAARDKRYAARKARR